MATQADVRRIALSLPLVEEASSDFAFAVPNKGRLKGFAWVWKERVLPKKPRVPNPAVLAVRVANLGQRDLMISAEPVKFFTEPHYEGFPAVLVRLKEVSAADLKMLLSEGWRCMAPAELATGPTRTNRGRSAGLPQVSKVSKVSKAAKETRAATPPRAARGTHLAKSRAPKKRTQSTKPAKESRRIP